MSRATRAAGPGPSAAVQSFEGGPFDGRSYPGPIHGVRPDAGPGTIVLEIPYGHCLESALAWGQAHVHYTAPGNLGPSIPSRFVLYVNGRPGEWSYVNHAEG